MMPTTKAVFKGHSAQETLVENGLCVLFLFFLFLLLLLFRRRVNGDKVCMSTPLLRQIGKGALDGQQLLAIEDNKKSGLNSMRGIPENGVNTAEIPFTRHCKPP